MKENIRQHYKQLRRALSPQQRQMLSAQAAAHLQHSALWQSSQTIMAYLALPQELSLDSLYQLGWRQHKIMVIPISQPADLSLQLSCLTSFDDLTCGAYGIRELPAPKRRPIDAAGIDLCLIPGVAFDRFGHRLGFGAGYYDRFLPRLRPEAIKVGVAFAAQLADEPLPVDQYDISMDYLLTEQGLLPVLA